MTDQPKPAGICPECGRAFVLTKAGRLRSHLAPRRYGQQSSSECEGIDRKPWPTP